MIKDPTRVTVAAAPAMELVAIAATSTTAIEAITIKVTIIMRQREEASPSLSLYSGGEKGVKLEKGRKIRISARKS